MVTVGVLARFEAKPGNEADVERFFQEGLLIVQRQKASTVWFAFCRGPTTFGAFANEEERLALLSVCGPAWYVRQGVLVQPRRLPPLWYQVEWPFVGQTGNFFSYQGWKNPETIECAQWLMLFYQRALGVVTFYDPTTMPVEAGAGNVPQGEKGHV